MWEIKACIVCLSTGVRLYSLNTGKLRHEFNTVSGLKTYKGSGIPDHLCVECFAYVKKFLKFQQKCQLAHYTLQQMLAGNKEIRKVHMKAINRKQIGIAPYLSFIDLDRVHYEQHTFQWISTSRTSTSQYDFIPVAHYSTLTKEDTFESVMSNTSIEIEVSPNVKLEDKTNEISKFEVFKQPGPKNNTSMPHIVIVDTSNDLEDQKFAITMENVPTEFSAIDTDVTNNDMDSSNAVPDMDSSDVSNKVDFNEESDDMDNDDNKNESFGDMSCKLDIKVDGSQFNEEYAKMVPISVKEAKAAAEVKKLFMIGSHKCSTCQKAFKSQELLQTHSRLHDKHTKGTYHCEICDYYYKTQFLLQCHMTEKHMYKYLCRHCNEVSFDRVTAKTHYINIHQSKKWGDSRKNKTETTKKKKKRKKMAFGSSIFNFEPLTQEAQYKMIRDRKLSRNYLEAKYKCEFCFRGYRLMSTYSNHMAKHDPVVSGNLQCDMCKLYFRNQRKIYKHMNMYHLKRYSCKSCDFVSTNRAQAVSHYRWHNNVTYDCPHCFKKFTRPSTQLTHIRLKHPSGTYICHLCGHSFVSSAGLGCHKQMTHANQDVKEPQTPDTSDPHYCADCGIQFASEQAFSTHLGSSSKHVNTNISVQKNQRESRTRMRREMGVSGTSRAERAVGDVGVRGRRARNGTTEVHNTGVTTSNNCELCGKYLVNDVQARKHYETEHPGADYLRRYMCEICGHTAKQYANLIVHMRTHTNEKPYGCPHCERRFSMLSNRDRHLVVHTGEKKYQCQHCSRRFTQSSAVKLHIQTVHLKIPYAPWDKKNRKRRKELEAAGVSSDINLAVAPPLPCIPQPPQHKLMLETQGDYISAYITYSDE